MRQRAWVDEPVDRLRERDQGADEDRQHHGEPRKTLASSAVEEERESEWDSRQRITEVVDQIREKRDAECARVNERLHEGGQRKNREAPGDRADAGARTQDRSIDQPVRMPVMMSMGVRVPMLVIRPEDRDVVLGPAEQQDMPVAATMRMTMNPVTVAM